MPPWTIRCFTSIKEKEKHLYKILNFVCSSSGIHFGWFKSFKIKCLIITKKIKIASSCGQTTLVQIYWNQVPCFLLISCFYVHQCQEIWSARGRKYCCIGKIIWQGKNEHQSFLSPMFSRRSYSELKRRKKIQLWLK